MGVIYKATNLINGKIYIGQTKKELKRRISEHKSDSKPNGRKQIFYNAIRKHGFENFEWKIIDSAENKIELNEKEIYWIKFYRSNIKEFGYNLTEGGDGVVGCIPNEETRRKLSESHKGQISHFKGKTHTEETRAIIKEKRKLQVCTDETRKKMSESRKGKKINSAGMIGRRQTEETKKKMSESKKGISTYRKGLPLSEEHKRKISEAHKRNMTLEKRIEISNKLKGHIVSEETRRKISETLKGKR